jgi:MFS family permease
VLRSVLIAGLCQFVMMLISGWLSDAIGRKPVMIAAAFGLAMWAPIFFLLAKQESIGLLAFGICVGASLHGLIGGAEGAWIAELFPTRYRYAGSSLVFQGASIVAGGPAPLIATALMGAAGHTAPVVIYVSVCALVSVVAVASGPETKGIDLAAIK